MCLRLIRRSDSVITAHWVHLAARTPFGTDSGIRDFATATLSLPCPPTPRRAARARSGVRRSRPQVDIWAPVQVRPSARAAKTRKTCQPTRIRDAAAAASRPPAAPRSPPRGSRSPQRAQGTARCRTTVPVQFQSPRAREKWAGGVGWGRSGRNFEVCVYVSEKVHWVVGSGLESCLTSRGACVAEFCSSHRSTLPSLSSPPAGVASL